MAKVDRPAIADRVALDEPELLVAGDGGIDMGGPDPDPVADLPVAEFAWHQRDVFVGAEQHVTLVPRRVAVVHPERLEPALEVDDDFKGSFLSRSASPVRLPVP